MASWYATAREPVACEHCVRTSREAGDQVRDWSHPRGQPWSDYFQNVATTNDAAMQPMPTSMFQLPMAFMNGMYAPPM